MVRLALSSDLGRRYTEGWPGEKVYAGCTYIDQIEPAVIDMTKYSDGGAMEKLLESQNIIVNKQLIPGDLQAGRRYANPGGIRVGVAELTRLGMGKGDMVEVVQIMHWAMSGSDRRQVVKDVKEFRKGFQAVKYTFGKSPAYLF